VRFPILFVSLSALSLILGAQERECPHFSGAAKNRVEKQARWLVSESLQERVAQRSRAFGHLIKYEQCHILKSRLLSDEDTVLQEGPFFFADGVELQSLVGRYRETWIMAVVPREATAKMPDANLLELTAHHWVLMYRDKDGSKSTLGTGKY
jgi:hypothetical protein